MDSLQFDGSWEPFFQQRGSLLQELYDHHIPNNYDSHPAALRRATFPSVHHHHPPPHHTNSFPAHPAFLPDTPSPSHLYAEPLLLSPEPLPDTFAPSPHSPFLPHHHHHHHHHPLDDPVKLEDGASPAPVVVPSQAAAFFHALPEPHPHHLPAAAMSPYLSPHTGLPITHTDDAASKETQFLRRRCFNCHTTEPPSWRRSTLNPGKIVCNKCGLYERTHLRPRPLRFDELRAGNKSRKPPALKGPSPKVAAALSPKAAQMHRPSEQQVKKEHSASDFASAPAITRRSSVSSSSASSVHSSSDWDETVSVYSASSNPPSSYNSPAASTFPIPRDDTAAAPRSPPPQQQQQQPARDPIRLPNAPLADVASLQQQHAPPPRLPAPAPPRGMKAAAFVAYAPAPQPAAVAT